MFHISGLCRIASKSWILNQSSVLLLVNRRCHYSHASRDKYGVIHLVWEIFMVILKYGTELYCIIIMLFLAKDKILYFIEYLELVINL